MNKLINLASIALFIPFILLIPPTEVLCEQPKVSVDWQLNIKWQDVPLAEIPITDTRIKFIDGHANIFLTVDNSELSKGVSYKAEGVIDKGKIYLSEYDIEIDQLKGGFVIENKELKMDSLEGQFKSIPFNLQGNISLIPPYPFDTKIKAKDVVLEEISTVLPFLKKYSDIKVPAEAEFNVKGMLPSGPVEGTVNLQEALAYSILMNNVEISFVWDGNKVLIKNFAANLDEGKISGEGEIFLNIK